MADKNFLTEIIDADLAEGKVSEIHTRFPPEPNGYLHIGSAKAIFINYTIAKHYGGLFNLRFEVHYRTFATYQLLTSWGTVSGLLLTCRKRRSGRRSTHVCGTRSPSTVTNVLPSSGIMVIAP